MEKATQQRSLVMSAGADPPSLYASAQRDLSQPHYTLLRNIFLIYCISPINGTNYFHAKVILVCISEAFSSPMKKFGFNHLRPENNP